MAVDETWLVDRISTRSLLRALGGNGTRGRLSACMRLRAGELMDYSEMIDYCYGDDADGGPDSPRDVIHNSVHVLRAGGMVIQTLRHRGYIASV